MKIKIIHLLAVHEYIAMDRVFSCREVFVKVFVYQCKEGVFAKSRMQGHGKGQVSFIYPLYD